MGRKMRQERLEEIWQVVQENPGQCPAKIAVRLGLHRSEVTRSLPSMDSAGLLLYEDERGGLWPFKRRKKK